MNGKYKNKVNKEDKRTDIGKEEPEIHQQLENVCRSTNKVDLHDLRTLLRNVGHFFTIFGQPDYRKLTLYEMNANLQISRSFLLTLISAPLIKCNVNFCDLSFYHFGPKFLTYSGHS